jgi:hypothetical protein
MPKSKIIEITRELVFEVEEEYFTKETISFYDCKKLLIIIEGFILANKELLSQYSPKLLDYILHLEGFLKSIHKIRLWNKQKEQELRTLGIIIKKEIENLEIKENGN